jgi:catechol 2,3-dioxygenase-like lactoylglutathione lyase family enzyme
MNEVTLGNHSRLLAHHSEQERIRAFYCGVLGCTLTKQTKNVDYLRFPGPFFLAVLYQDQVPTAASARDAIWLELRATDPPALTRAILEFGAERIETVDVDHLYFQAPGGQVFRVVGVGEDLSRFER